MDSDGFADGILCGLRIYIYKNNVEGLTKEDEHDTEQGEGDFKEGQGFNGRK